MFVQNSTYTKAKITLISLREVSIAVEFATGNSPGIQVSTNMYYFRKRIMQKGNIKMSCQNCHIQLAVYRMRITHGPCHNQTQ